jgi:anti-sigma factor RsiW
MCDFHGKLIAWMDGELPESEAARTKEHVNDCAECRAKLASYRQASDGFAAVCDATVAVAETRRERARWILAATGVAATVALLLVLLPRHGTHSPAGMKAYLSTPAPVTTATSAPEVRSPPTRLSVRRANPLKAKTSERLFAARLPGPSVEPVPEGPSIEIAIPSDAIFPPGAMPAGMSFVANVTLRSDGSAERMGLRPRAVGFERRANQ